MSELPSDTSALRKARGAFFTPPAIANYLASWAVEDDPSARVLDPTCGEAVFLAAAGRELRAAGCAPDQLKERIYGVDVHRQSLDEAQELLADEGVTATLLADDFFSVPTPNELGCPLPEMDAVIGNPPFIRYQQHVGPARDRSRQAALAQGVRLSKLASSWAALLVHACSFLRPDGRLAMILPAELLTVGYAEPVRRWLRERFAAVHLVLFERLQFAEVSENVVLLIARGSGGCDSFSFLPVRDAEELPQLRLFGRKHFTVSPAHEGKWTDLLLPRRRRQLFRQVVEKHFVALGDYGAPHLGTVTGANYYFALTDATRQKFGLSDAHVTPISPPGTKHLRGLTFTKRDWERLREQGEAVWMLWPKADDVDDELAAYLEAGIERGVPEAYKCTVRTPWWRPPRVVAPDLFFTYMSHRYPRLVTNTAGVTLVNSMHGVQLRPDIPKPARNALPLLALNSVTMLGAEVFGRSYGGGILKMEPREASSLPVPATSALLRAWEALKPERGALDARLREGLWIHVVKRVDEVLLSKTLQLPSSAVTELFAAAQSLRERRTRQIEHG